MSVSVLQEIKDVTNAFVNVCFSSARVQRVVTETGHGGGFHGMAGSGGGAKGHQGERMMMVAVVFVAVMMVVVVVVVMVMVVVVVLCCNCS